MSQTRTTCLMTISDAEFSIATEVLLYSFHKYNPDYDGDVLIIHEDLPEEHRRRLESFGPVRFEAPDKRLAESVERLRAIEPRLQQGIHRRLFSLEAFRLGGYERVVYLDSDIYCAGDLSQLFTARAPLLACLDGFTLGDDIRKKLAPDNVVEPSERYGRTFKQSFNAGVLSIGAALLGEGSYLNILKRLETENWNALGQSKFTDQMLLNVHFDGQFEILPASYNYMIFLETYQKLMDAVSFLDARLVHFAGAVKPWFEYPDGVLSERAPQFIKFIDAWRELLHEARQISMPTDHLAEQFEAQQDWIRRYNETPIEPTGRIR